MSKTINDLEVVVKFLSTLEAKAQDNFYKKSMNDFGKQYFSTNYSSVDEVPRYDSTYVEVNLRDISSAIRSLMSIGSELIELRKKV